MEGDKYQGEEHTPLGDYGAVWFSSFFLLCLLKAIEALGFNRGAALNRGSWG